MLVSTFPLIHAYHHCGTTTPGRTHIPHGQHDRLNRYRQAILALEKRMLLTSFYLKLATTMMGFVCTNSFFAIKKDI